MESLQRAKTLDKLLECLSKGSVDEGTHQRVTRCFASGDPSESEKSYADSHLFKTLQKARAVLQKDPERRSIVVDSLEDITEDSLWLCLPKLCAKKGLFNFSLSYCSVRTLEPQVFEDWHVNPIPGPRGSALLSRHGMAFVVSDQPRHVVKCANMLAEKEPQSLVLRVLRVAPRESLLNNIKSVLQKPTPDNVLNIWIRHHEHIEMSGMGKFQHTIDDQVTLEQLLTDVVEADELSTPFRHDSAPTPAPNVMYSVGSANSSNKTPTAAMPAILTTFIRSVSSLSSPGSIIISPVSETSMVSVSRVATRSSISPYQQETAPANLQSRSVSEPKSGRPKPDNFVFEDPHGEWEEPFERQSIDMKHNLRIPSLDTPDPKGFSSKQTTPPPTRAASVVDETPIASNTSHHLDESDYHSATDYEQGLDLPETPPGWFDNGSTSPLVDEDDNDNISLTLDNASSFGGTSLATLSEIGSTSHVSLKDVATGTPTNEGVSSTPQEVSPAHSVLSALAFMGDFDEPELDPPTNTTFTEMPKQPLGMIRSAVLNIISPKNSYNVMCTSCNQSKKSSMFTKSQLRKVNKRCTACVEIGQKVSA